MAEKEGEVGRAGSVRDGVAPGKAALIENTLGESVGSRRVQQVPVELFHKLIMIAADERRHSGIGGEVGVNGRLLRARPADRALVKAAAMPLAHLSQQCADARIGPSEQLRRPEHLGIAPVCSHLFPAWREPGQTSLLPGGVNGAAVIITLLLEVPRVSLLAQLAGGIHDTQEPAQVPEVVADDMMLAVPEILAIGDGIG